MGHVILRTEKNAPEIPIEPSRLCEPMPASEPRSARRRRQGTSPIPYVDSTRGVPITVVEHWANLVANRRMWGEAGVKTNELADQCRQQLRDFGVDESSLQTLDKADCVEVSIPFVSDERDAARDFPWEFVIASATKEARRNGPITVVRHLNQQDSAAAPAAPAPKNFCFIECAPKPFDRFYGFQMERRQIQEALGFEPDPSNNPYGECFNPSRSDLEKVLAKRAWDVVHFTGLDVHQGVEILKAYGLEQESPLVRAYDKASTLSDGRTSRPPDGLVILNENRQLDCLKANDLAVTLEAQKPMLVTMNLYNSACNLAALAVGHGAGAAIGLQDNFDEGLTDKFYSAFYLGWNLGKWELLPAFAYALQQLPPTTTGLVLWSGTSLLEGGPL